MRTEPRALPLVGHAVGSVGAASALAATLPPLPAAPTEFPEWWADAGPVTAAVAIVQLAGITVAAWLAVTSAAGLALTVRPSRGSRRLWYHLSTPTLRRLVGGGIVVAAGTVSPVHAADDTPTVVDLGPTPDQPIVLVDLGPAPITDPALEPPDPGPADAQATDEIPAAETWLVERGDHLWHIAEETLHDRGAPTSERDVAAYWRRVIAANRDVIGADPDVIHPGVRIVLPD